MLRTVEPTRFTPPTSRFTEEQHGTWADILAIHRTRREQQLHPMFTRGLRALDMDVDRIPSLDDVNAKLTFLTGWKGVFVKGLEDAQGFPAVAQQAVPHRRPRARSQRLELHARA